MTSERMKPGAEFWATVVVVVAALEYPMSLGPAFWWAFHCDSDLRSWGLMHTSYKPIFWIGRRSTCAASAIHWYLELGVPNKYSYFNETIIGYADR